MYKKKNPITEKRNRNPITGHVKKRIRLLNRGAKLLIARIGLLDSPNKKNPITEQKNQIAKKKGSDYEKIRLPVIV